MVAAAGSWWSVLDWTHLHMVVVSVLEAKVVLLYEIQRIEHLVTESLAQILFLKQCVQIN